jgi:protein-tyrosine-phosphatase
MAEAMFRAAVKDRHDFEVASAGVSATPGTPASRGTRSVLQSRGLTLDGFASRLVSDELIEGATHVFAMTVSHLTMLHAMFPEHEDKLFLTCEFVDLPGRGVGCDVPDPIGSGVAAYEEVAGTLELAIPTLVAFIDQTWK